MNIEGLNKIVGIRAKSNFGINNNKIKKCFPDLIPIERPTVGVPIVPHPEWLAGFASAESCFYVNVRKPSTMKCGFGVKLTFSLSQHSRDEVLIKSIIKYLGCGILGKNREIVEFIVNRLSDNMTIIIPFFLKYPIKGVKHKDFQDWCKVGNIMLQRKHLTLRGVQRIIVLKSKMNTKRVIE